MSKLSLIVTFTMISISFPAYAQNQQPSIGIEAPNSTTTLDPFDIIHTKITTKDNVAIFSMAVSGKAGASKPTPTVQLTGSNVFSYVWQTSLDSYTVGFKKKAGILALAVTAHPDFDDTPLYDENNYGNVANDGYIWHSHWVVLQPNEKCGKGS